MSQELVRRTEPMEYVVELTMSNPDRRNAMSHGLIEQLAESLGWAAVAGIRAVIIRAEPGASTWSSGHDISELPTEGAEDYVNPLEDLFRLIRSSPFPVIAAVEGGVWGGGCNLVMACDLALAVRGATFAITPVRLGVPYDAAGVRHFLEAMPTHIAREMFFTGDPVSAQRLLEVGVLNSLVADETELTTQARALAARIAERAPLSVRAIKAEITNQTGGPEWDTQSQRKAAWRSSDYQEGLSAFHAKRSPRFLGQ